MKLDKARESAPLTWALLEWARLRPVPAAKRRLFNEAVVAIAITAHQGIEIDNLDQAAANLARLSSFISEEPVDPVIDAGIRASLEAGREP